MQVDLKKIPEMPETRVLIIDGITIAEARRTRTGDTPWSVQFKGLPTVAGRFSFSADAFAMEGFMSLIAYLMSFMPELPSSVKITP